MLASHIPIGVLFDSDGLGKSAKEFLTDKFKWNGKHVFQYRRWRMDQTNALVEAEDMFEETLLKHFVDTHPPTVVSETAQYKDRSFHYGFTQDGKDAFLRFLKAELKAEHVGRWVTMMADIRKAALGLKDAGEKERLGAGMPQIIPLSAAATNARAVSSK